MIGKNRLVKSVIGFGVLAIVGAACAGAVSSGSDPTSTSNPVRSNGVPSSSLPVGTATPSQAPTATAGSVGDLTAPTTSQPSAPGPGDSPVSGITSSVVPDPNYEDELRRAQLGTGGWKTDFSRHTVSFDSILSGGVARDGIPPIDNPKFVDTRDANEWLADNEPVIATEINGDAKAYPLQIITWHEIVNDTLGGVPISATFCPLCNSAIVFDRRLDGVTYDFGVSGKLRNSDLIMWDRQTQSWWQQFTGEGIIGVLAGKQLATIPASIISWKDFRDAKPDGLVLSRDTGYTKPYGSNPYAGYDRVDQPPFLFDGNPDGRLLPMERVAAVTLDNIDIAFPFTILQEERVVHYGSDDKSIVIFFVDGTASALDQRTIRDSKDIGSTGVFLPVVDGQALTFRYENDAILDNETGSAWNILGEAKNGPLAGTQLSLVLHANHFWFAWGAFKPDTKIYQGVAS